MFLRRLVRVVSSNFYEIKSILHIEADIRVTLSLYWKQVKRKFSTKNESRYARVQFQRFSTFTFFPQGTEGFERQIDHLMELSEYMVKKIKSMPDKYHLILEPQMVNVSFWYVPKRLRSMPHTPERVKMLGEVSTIPHDPFLAPKTAR